MVLQFPFFSFTHWKNFHNGDNCRRMIETWNSFKQKKIFALCILQENELDLNLICDSIILSTLKVFFLHTEMHLRNFSSLNFSLIRTYVILPFFFYAARKPFKATGHVRATNRTLVATTKSSRQANNFDKVLWELLEMYLLYIQFCLWHVCDVG